MEQELLQSARSQQEKEESAQVEKCAEFQVQLATKEQALYDLQQVLGAREVQVKQLQDPPWSSTQWKTSLPENFFETGVENFSKPFEISSGGMENFLKW